MQFGVLVLVFLFSYFLVPHSENSYFWRLPPLLKDVPLWINTFLDNLMFKWFTVDIWDPVWKDYEQKTIFRISLYENGYLNLKNRIPSTKLMCVLVCY